MRKIAMSVVLISVLSLSLIFTPFPGVKASPASEGVTLNIMFGTLSFELPPGYHIIEWGLEKTSARANGLPIESIFTRKDGSREIGAVFTEDVGFSAAFRPCGDSPDLRALIQELQLDPDREVIFQEGNVNVPGDAGATYPGYCILCIDEGDIHARIDGYLMVLLEPGYAAHFSVMYSVEWVDYTIEEGTWTFTVDGQSPIAKHKADAASMIASARISWQSSESSFTPTISTPPTQADISPPEEQVLFMVKQLQDEVFVQESGSSNWEPVSPSTEAVLLSEGYAVRTGQGTVCLENLPDQEDRVFVGENTEFRIEEQGTMLNMRSGSIRVVKKRLQDLDVYRGIDPNKPLAVTWVSPVRGTDFIVDVTDERAEMLVFEGIVELSDLERHKTVQVEAGESSVVVAGGLPSEPQKFDSDTVFEKYFSLFESEEEMKAVVGDIEKSTNNGTTKGFPIYLVAILVIIVIAVIIIILVLRRKK